MQTIQTLLGWAVVIGWTFVIVLALIVGAVQTFGRRGPPEEE